MYPLPIINKAILITDTTVVVIEQSGSVNKYNIPPDCEILISKELLTFIPIEDETSK